MVFCRSLALFHGTSFCSLSLQDHRYLHLGEYQTPGEMVLPATHLGKGSQNWMCNILPAWSAIFFSPALELQMDPQSPPPTWKSMSCRSALGTGNPESVSCSAGPGPQPGSGLCLITSPPTVLEYLLLKCVGCVSSGPHSTGEETC